MKFLRYFFFLAISALAFSCGDSRTQVTLECDERRCDTIDVYEICFIGEDTLCEMLYNDTVSITEKVRYLRLRAWRCGSCKGYEMVQLISLNGKKLLGEIKVSYDSNEGVSELYDVQKLQADRFILDWKSRHRQPPQK